MDTQQGVNSPPRVQAVASLMAAERMSGLMPGADGGKGDPGIAHWPGPTLATGLRNFLEQSIQGQPR